MKFNSPVSAKTYVLKYIFILFMIPGMLKICILVLIIQVYYDRCPLSIVILQMTCRVRYLIPSLILHCFSRWTRTKIIDKNNLFPAFCTNRCKMNRMVFFHQNTMSTVAYQNKRPIGHIVHINTSSHVNLNPIVAWGHGLN